MAPATPRSSAVTASPLLVDADDDTAHAVAHIGQVGGQGQDGHDLGGDGDVKAGVAGHVFFGAKTDLDLAQEAVVGIDHTAPGDAGRIDIQAGKAGFLGGGQLVGIGLVDAEFLQPAQHGRRELTVALLIGGAQGVEQLFVIGLLGFVENASVDGRGQQVIGCGDGVDIAGQVQVEIFHRDDLAVTAAGRAAFDAKGRTLAGLADAGEDPLAEVGAERLAQTHHGGALALTERGGSDGGHIDVLAIRDVLEALQHIQANLGFVSPVKLDLLWQQADFLSYQLDRLQLGCLSDLDIGRDWKFQVQFGWCEFAKSGELTWFCHCLTLSSLVELF